MISDDSELTLKVTESECYLPKNDNFNPELLYCIGDDSADSSDSTLA